MDTDTSDFSVGDTSPHSLHVLFSLSICVTPLFSSVKSSSHVFIFYLRKFYLLLDGEIEKDRERERDIDLLFHSSMHSLFDSYMRTDRELNLWPWNIRTALQPTDPPAQGCIYF